MKPKSYLRIPLWWPSLPKNWRGWLPSRGNVVFTLVIAGLLILGQSVGALPLGVPSSAPAAASIGTIAYQGRLADAAGTPVTDSINMTFRLYDAATGGIPLWEEPWDGPNAVQVSDGLFNVMLGSLQQLPQAVIAGHDQLFLGITVGTDDEMLPRVQLGSVPFAVQALTIPDGSVTTAKIADGAVNYAKQTLATYSARDNTYQHLQGLNSITVSEFRFENVPAGEIMVTATLIASLTQNASPRGVIRLEIAGTSVDNIPTHAIPAASPYTQLTMHGRMAGFAGGTLIVRVIASAEIAETDIKFGDPNGDSRFGRRVTVIAGM